MGSEAPVELISRARAWTRYWQSGARHACAGSFQGHYGEATRAFWRAQFARVGVGDRVLELGCGNGSLIQWWVQCGAPWPDAINAVDLADLDLHWLAQLPAELRARVHVHARTSAQALPLADASVTHIYSQYALEYFANERCWQELFRVMAPRVTVAAVVHHRDGYLCRLAREEVLHCDWLLSEQGVLAQAAALLPWWIAAADPLVRQRIIGHAKAEQARAEFNKAMAQLNERCARTQFPDLLRDTAERIMAILQAAPTLGGTTAQCALDALRADLADNRLRVAELVDAALDAGGLVAWQQHFLTAGFSVFDVSELIERDHLFGWTIVASRTQESRQTGRSP
ncbi:Methyltransferase domain-containing protein [Fontimonas thermophila]|uniref:Methyltransferase domain-containing protein n=1 Tax=Fontimonas thermophila TaxID=1076937 RepID=A0A1I2KQ93_9GAMM|nr:Methyltransferase domain-containing protein [Fontimonas thermophila]